MFRLAHLSDPHLGPMPDTRIRDLLSKRVIGYVNWHRSRARSMTATWLDGLVEDIHATAPDHIAVTGDLVNIALDLEISAARAWMDALAPPHLASLVPGNHDAYVPGALRRAIKAWAPYMTGDDAPDVAFPYVRRRGPLALIGVSSARASGPWFATGRVGSRQAKALRTQLQQLGAEGAFRVLMIHHPPHRGATAWNKRLTDASHVRAAIKRAGCELVLHGHTHLATRMEIDSPNGPVPVIGVPSASNSPGHKRPAARYNLFSISGSPGQWHCEMEERGYPASASSDAATVEHLASRHLAIPG
ncbi:metallophosphoesterase [Stappia sp. ES.058]|uniref:metallophosphoesterase family protein n=1 Tax=Stappia sp. ES.058 TaxID=1881061 RepID=UPI00087DCC92|nr:metallophosphoesterase [Stappia sp. ES.058]SDU30075.1 3',5'-cyclic AMP phosphodiesterase CpdA [Stappia sp. ES.058]